MEQYHELLKRVLGEGDVVLNQRTGQHTIGVSADSKTYDLREGFPLLTTKNVYFKGAAEELFWKLRGERNVLPLMERGIHIWDANAFDMHLRRNNRNKEVPKNTPEWNEEFARYKERILDDPEFAKTEGDLGPVYGFQWRHGFKHNGKEVDQLANLLDGIQNNPSSRYHILNAWNPAETKNMALPPCPFWHQFTVYDDQLDLTMDQRSCDVFLGVPFNITQDALMLHLVAQETNLNPRYFNHHFNNLHAYLGVPPRADFWSDSGKVKEFQDRFNQITQPAEFMELRDWYLKTAPPESPGNERKDHTPFILEQLSKEPRSLPYIELKDGPLLDVIQKPVKEVSTIKEYNPHKWDAQAMMAA